MAREICESFAKVSKNTEVEVAGRYNVCEQHVHAAYPRGMKHVRRFLSSDISYAVLFAAHIHAVVTALPSAQCK